MSLSHVDRPPLGDVCESVAVMAATNPQATLVLEVEAGAESCLAQGAELAAFGAVAARCAALLGERRRARRHADRRARHATSVAHPTCPIPRRTTHPAQKHRQLRLRRWTLWTYDSSKGAWDD